MAAVIGRAIGLGVHLDFCELAICEEGKVRSAGRVASTPEALKVLAEGLSPADTVALEVSGSAWEIATILEPHVAKVTVVSPGDTGITQARARTDRLDARTLAKLLWSGELDAVWVPDQLTRVLRRRLARREQLMRARTRTKNEVHAMLMRQLVGRPPFSDLFGIKGRQWLRQDAPATASATNAVASEGFIECVSRRTSCESAVTSTDGFRISVALHKSRAPPSALASRAAETCHAAGLGRSPTPALPCADG